jgi:hypothetical protein
MFRQQLHCWLAARFAKQIELPPHLVVYHGNSQRAEQSAKRKTDHLCYTLDYRINNQTRNLVISFRFL